MQLSLNNYKPMETDVKDIIYKKFLGLSLSEKLVIYAKFVNKDTFRIQDNDLFGLNRRSASKIYKSFTNDLREILVEGKNDKNSK